MPAGTVGTIHLSVSSARAIDFRRIQNAPRAASLLPVTKMFFAPPSRSVLLRLHADGLAPFHRIGLEPLHLLAENALIGMQGFGDTGQMFILQQRIANAS